MPVERHPSGQHLEDDDAEAVDVGPLIDRAGGQLLGRGVRDRADELVGARQPRLVGGFAEVRNAEIDDLVDLVAAGEVVADDVGRLQIAMDDAAAVRELQRVAERRHDAPDVVHLQPAALGDLVLDARAR